MIQAQDFGDYTLADDSILDGFQTLTDAAMTTGQSLTELAIRFFINLLASWILVRCFYYPKSRRRDYYFTFMIFSTAMLLLLYIMGNVEIGVGLTLGLFAIFGIIRYRTETVPIREMTYLFVIIALAAVNGLSPVYKLLGASSACPHYGLSLGSVGITLIANALVIVLVWVLERGKTLGSTSTKLILYDRIDLIVPDRREELMADIEKRIGVKPESVEVGYVDLLKDAAYVKVTYVMGSGQTGSIDNLTKAKDFIG